MEGGNSEWSVQGKKGKVLESVKGVRQGYVETVGITNESGIQSTYRVQERLTMRGRNLLRNLLNKMAASYKGNKACGINVENVKIQGESCELLSEQKEAFTTNSYVKDIQGLEVIMDKLSPNGLPIDVKHLLDYMKENYWEDWMVYHPATWSDDQLASSYLFLKEVLSNRSLDTSDLPYFKGKLSAVWTGIAKEYGEKNPKPDYWKKFIPKAIHNQSMHDVYNYIMNRRTDAGQEISTSHSEMGYIYYCRSLLVHYKDYYWEHEKESDNNRKKSVILGKIAKNIWVMQPDFMSLLMQNLLRKGSVPSLHNKNRLKWRGLMLPAIYNFHST